MIHIHTDQNVQKLQERTVYQIKPVFKFKTLEKIYKLARMLYIHREKKNINMST
jgi:hypothetical protein